MIYIHPRVQCVPERTDPSFHPLQEGDTGCQNGVMFLLNQKLFISLGALKKLFSGDFYFKS